MGTMILAGDIGGTNIRLALFRCHENGFKLFREDTLLSRNYGSLIEAVKTFLLQDKALIRSACFGVAGPINQGKCKMTNLPWLIDTKELIKYLGISLVVLLNDLEATAYGVLKLTDKEFHTLNIGVPDLQGNRAIIAVGTGLGKAILFQNGTTYLPVATEGGHCDFAPRNAIEIALLEYLLKRYSRVSYERVLSGSGLFNIYQFLKKTGRGEEPAWLSERLTTESPGAVISEVALAGKSTLCIKALNLFVTLYGAEAGNLALTTMATGGIYVGGGIAPKIIQKLIDGTFMKAFCDKGRYSAMLHRIPVHVIMNDKAALLGAAHVAQKALIEGRS